MARRTPWPDLPLVFDNPVAASPLFSQPLWSANPENLGGASSERARAVPGRGGNSVAVSLLFIQPLWSVNPGTLGCASSERAVAVPGWGASW